MWTRFQIWKVRRQARILSKYVGMTVVASIGQVPLGRYKNGKRTGE